MERQCPVNGNVMRGTLSDAKEMGTDAMPRLAPESRALLFLQEMGTDATLTCKMNELISQGRVIPDFVGGVGGGRGGRGDCCQARGCRSPPLWNRLRDHDVEGISKISMESLEDHISLWTVCLARGPTGDQWQDATTM